VVYGHGRNKQNVNWRSHTETRQFWVLVGSPLEDCADSPLVDDASMYSSTNLHSPTFSSANDPCENVSYPSTYMIFVAIVVVERQSLPLLFFLKRFCHLASGGVFVGERRSPVRGGSAGFFFEQAFGFITGPGRSRAIRITHLGIASLANR
jgi:hypothetical protein